jgi:predicted dithiol-disulfide oxidoreductase (DUF899 family)
MGFAALRAEETLMSLPPAVTREQWLAALRDFHAREQELARLQDALMAERRRLPMVRVDKQYSFEGPAGTVTLADLFDGCQQLIIQHFMFDPTWDRGCASCAALADEISSGLLVQLRERETAFAVVSLAPLAKITAYKERRGWSFPWYSSYGTGFNYDFHVTLDETRAPVVYDYQAKADVLRTDPDNELVRAEIPVELPGISCFLRSGDSVFHTYSTYASGIEQVSAVRNYLELTAFGAPAL